MSKKLQNNQMANLIKGVINEQFLTFQCEPGVCQCGPAFVPNPTIPTYANIADCENAVNCCMRWDCYPDGAGVCEPVNNTNATFATEAECLLVHPNGCLPQPRDYDCVLGTNGFTCVVTPGGPFTGPTAQADCNTAVANNTSPCNEPDPDEDYDCIPTELGGFTCIVTPGGPFTGPTAQADCNTAVANNVSPCNIRTPRAYECDIVDCRCIQDPNGSFTGPTALQDCNAALQDPNHECCCVDCDPPDPCEQLMQSPIYEECCAKCKNGSIMSATDPCNQFCRCCKEYDCLEKEPGSGKVCVEIQGGPFDTMADCQAALADPKSKCNRTTGDGGWECQDGSGCVYTGNGPYPDQATCEANSDDHYNIGGLCKCNCPGQPEGCDSTPLISTVMIHNGEYNGIHGQPFFVGNYDLDLNIAKDGNGPLLTQAFRDRMAPCGPSYRAPLGRVKHDCAFWEFVSTKKLPDKYSQVISPASQGGLASVGSESPWQMAHSTAPASGGTSLGGYPWHAWDPGPDGIQGTADDTPMIHATTGQPINPYQGQQSSTAHPRWQRRIEAKIAYISCLRDACCGNTKWPGAGMQFTPYM